MKCISNDAVLWSEDKCRGVELERRRVSYRVVARDKALCIVKEPKYLAAFYWLESYI